jgi:hypothetical protein
MYQIRYLDPITGTVLEAQSHVLEEAISSIKKAKDNLYFKGYPSTLDTVDSTKNSDLAPEPVIESTPTAESETEYEAETPSIEDEDYWYPHGVALW